MYCLSLSLTIKLEHQTTCVKQVCELIKNNSTGLEVVLLILSSTSYDPIVFAFNGVVDGKGNGYYIISKENDSGTWSSLL